MLGWSLVFASAVAGLPEGWWPPDGPDPHPSGLREGVRARVSAATVHLGEGRSGTFVSRDGLILTSAAAIWPCVRALRAEGLIRKGAFVAEDKALAPKCPDLKVRARIDVRDVTGAVVAAERAGSTQVRDALVSACQRVGVARRCEVIASEDGVRRLLVRREISPVRLRFWPGDGLAGLGGSARDFDLPHLRLDAALVSVELGRTGVPGDLSRAVRLPSEDDALWVAHHPGPSLRGRSALEAEVFQTQVLPTYVRRAQAVGVDPRHRRALTLLGAMQEPLARARRRELAVLSRIKTLPPERALAAARAFTNGRDEYRAAPWAAWAAAAGSRPSAASPKPGPAVPSGPEEGLMTKPLLAHWARSLPPLSTPEVIEAMPSHAPDAAALDAYHQGERVRRATHLATGHPAIGPDGQEDLRISGGFVVEASHQQGWRVPWSAVIDAAARTGVPLELPSKVPWPGNLAIGFQMVVDTGPLTTGGPVINGRGELVGIVASGDQGMLAGALIGPNDRAPYGPRNEPSESRRPLSKQDISAIGRVSVTSMQALILLLERVHEARTFVRAIRD